MAEDVACLRRDGRVGHDLRESGFVKGFLPVGKAFAPRARCGRGLKAETFDLGVFAFAEIVRAAGLVVRDADEVIAKVALFVGRIAVMRQGGGERDERLLHDVVAVESGEFRLDVSAQEFPVAGEEFRPADAVRVVGQVLQEGYGCQWRCGHGGYFTFSGTAVSRRKIRPIRVRKKMV